MISHRDAEFGTKLCNSRPLAALRVRFAQATRRLRRGRISSLRETKCLSHRIAAKVAPPAVGTKIAHPLATFALLKLLVLLVGGPDDFVAGASRAHPIRPLRGGRIALVVQPDRLRRQANVAIHNHSFDCGTTPHMTDSQIERLERKVVMTTLTACPTGKGRRATTPPRLSSDTCSA